MRLFDYIEEQAKDGAEEKTALWSVLKNAISDCKVHLTQITTQLYEFDIHDKSHSEKVLENIEKLLGDKMYSLSFLEATLIYASCYFHDAAMALPRWEYDLLKAFEGCEENHHQDIKPCIRNDFKPVQSLNEIKRIIEENKSDIYGDYSRVENYIFAPDSEEDLNIDLAKRVQSYEEFRNGFSDQLKNLKTNAYEYLNYSQAIRAQFIRESHNKRIVELIGYMRKRFRAAMNKSTADYFLNILGIVCKAHGDGADDIRNLPLNFEIDALGRVNIQFVAIMLRLGDIIHFSSDRAPVSLFAEKKITDPVSCMHWTSKSDETRYEFIRKDSKTTVQFKAYCLSPETYYFLHDYLDCVDDEIALYFTFLQQLEYDNVDNRENYDIQIAITTDRTEIEYDQSLFTPDKEAKFTLDQSKILGLLTGAQLYKDEYLCLRELYQNSLDACKCMKAIDKTRNVSGNYKISFGLSTDGNGQKYIYCLDNGTGMTMDIVKNHLLCVGNSYYKSRDFMRKNVNWSNEVNPTSQFGIGLLSCFMLGDKLEITTKHYEDSNTLLSFVIEGANERFYHIPPTELDNELIGEHGTLVKIILNEKISRVINSKIPKDLQYFIFAGNNSLFDETFDEASFIEFENSLFWKVNKQIGIPAPKIEVCVFDDNDSSHLTIPFNEIFDFRNYKKTDVSAFASVWERYFFIDGIENPYRDVISCRDFITDIPICVEVDGVELHTFISLPKKGIPELNPHIFRFSRYLWRTDQLTILVDGVPVKETISYLDKFKLLGYGLSQNSSVIFNFTGEIRPILSVDRNNIINFPEDTNEVLEKLVSELIPKIVDSIVSHLREENLKPNSSEAQLAINSVLFMYEEFSGDILKQLSDTEYGLVKLEKIKFGGQKNNSLIDLVELTNVTLEDIDIRQLDTVSQQAVFGKSFEAETIEIIDHNLKIDSNKFSPPTFAFREDRTSLRHMQYVVRADKWEGCFEQYDLVTSLWPVVPERLFEKINEFERKDDIFLDDNRIKVISQTGNGLYGMGVIEPALVNPRIGISSHERNLYRKPYCLIGHVGSIQNYFNLFELIPHEKPEGEENKCYVLFEYVAPKELTEIDELKLNDYIVQDDTYIQGIREGWSILFLGYDCSYYILPGVREREELIELIPPSIRTSEIEYYNLDDTKLNFLQTV